LNQLDLVTLWRVDESNRTILAVGMRSVRKGVTLCGGLPRELFDIVDLESQVGEIWADDNRTTLIEFADFDFFLAAGRLEENQLRTATRGMAPCFAQAENIPVEGNRFFKVSHPIPGVEKLLYHCD
jgi:hypothetical protein